MARRGKWRLILGILLLSAGLVVVARRVRGTIEYRVLMGNEAERVELCRSLPLIAPSRQEWALQRLLRDSSEAVRSSAVAAVAQGARGDTSRILEIALDPDESRAVRAKAGLYLLKIGQKAYIDALTQQAGDRAFRAQFPALSANVLTKSIDTDPAERQQELIAMALDLNEPARVEIADVIRNYASQMKPGREWLLKQLAAATSVDQRSLLLQLLQVVEGRVRGASSEDWITDDIAANHSVEGQVVEAEWATDIRPNYQITEQQGVLCLALGEGGGGTQNWHKGHIGSVDIGTARLSLHVPKDGAYSIWARVYFDNKCGNSFNVFLNNQELENFSDRDNVMGNWHWLLLMQDGQRSIHLAPGFQQLRLQAREDAVFIDKFAVLPPQEDPEAYTDAAVMHWDPQLAPSLSFTCEKQSQPRGTHQYITVWVRRHLPSMREGTLTLEVPDGFQLASPNPTRITFAEGNPLARSTFDVFLPAGNATGEGILRAAYQEESDEPQQPVEGEFILGAQPDWLTTGPLPEFSDRARKLMSATTVTDAELAKDWFRFPAKGYDTFRRLSPEDAWGALVGCYMYFCTDIQVDQAGACDVYLNADDNASVWLDGGMLIVQPTNGPGEGRLVTETAELQPGRHRLFARLYQRDFEDPTGPDADRHSYNNSSFKLLIRQSRYVPSAHVKGLSMADILPRAE